ncbi:GNAT family N-acetyltransferase [Aureispira anguillae]|uniref:N-acetyltransferase n=1 Tax=Aureispira anguillae TaxID=2864201 RepID=A0A915YGC8_9BACT|nr:N-acetyltransferase [Aureispira anguillae]BDS12514.1 N-acetyltransferase [Aureispira anguillae]
MNLIIRQEVESDYASVFALIQEAFADEVYSDHREQFLVANLRKSKAFIPELSLVATIGGELAGHILLTKIEIKNAINTYGSLALAPVSVLPKFQGQGIGGELIKEAHKKAKVLGFKSIILLGHKDYYPRFGYQPTAKFGIKLPFDAPKENCMVIELVANGLEGVNGMVEYPKEFYH